MNNENPNTNVDNSTSEFKTVNPLEVGGNNAPVQEQNNVPPTQSVNNGVAATPAPNVSSTPATNDVVPAVTSQQQTVQQQNPVDNQQQGQTPDNNDKSKNIDYKPPGKFKTFVLILFFAGLVAFIIFLPEIQKFMAENGFGKKGNKTEEITTGKLVCTLESNTTNLDKTLRRTFMYTDKKLESATFVTTIKGDVTEDEKTLDSLADQCNLVKTGVSGLDGITVSCEYSSGKLVEKETFDYKSYDVEKVRAAYTEAGGDIIEYEYGHDIDKIMTSMRQSGFTCNKEK